MTTSSLSISQMRGVQSNNTSVPQPSSAPLASGVKKVKKSVLVFSYVFNAKEVWLKQKGDDLHYVVKDKKSGTQVAGGFDFDDDDTSDTEAHVKQLTKCFPKIEDDDEVEFVEPCVCQKREFFGHKVKLLLFEGSKVYWQVIDKAAQKAFFYPFDICSLTKHASRQTKRYFATLETRKEEEVALFLSEKLMGIIYIGKQLDPANINLADFRLRPVSVATKLNPGVLVSAMTFAVTLLAYSGSCKNAKCIGNNHAEVLVEGVDKAGEPFAHIIHLGPPIEILDVTNKPKIKYFQKSKTWKVSSRKVEKMYQAALADMAQGVKFNKLGQRSMFWFMGGQKGGYSCFTFARKMMAIVGIKIPVTPLDLIAPYTRLHTKGDNKFKNITDSCPDPDVL